MTHTIATPEELRSLAWSLEVPDHLVPGLVRYLIDRIRPGAFLCAVIANDLDGAISRAADGITIAGVKATIQFLFHAGPHTTGSYETLERWLAREERQTV